MKGFTGYLLNVPKKLYKQFFVLCFKKNVSMAKVLREYIRQFVDVHKKK